MGNKQEQFSAMLGGMTSDTPEQLAEIMRGMIARQERQRDAIKQAVNHASFADVDHGARTIEGIKILGQSVYDKYRDSPFALAGLAYTAGIAEGKQRERDRRRHAAIKKRIRDAAQAAQQATGKAE